MTIRNATQDDLPQIHALMKRSTTQHSDELSIDLPDDPGKHLLVLDDGRGELAAAAMLSITGDRGHLCMLVVADQASESRVLQERMLGVVEAMCDAYGVTTIDVPQHRAA